MTLRGRRALVTGGGTGVGADLARGLAAAGAEVVVAGRRREPLDEIAGSAAGIQSLVADVTDEGSVAELFSRAGPLDIVIANAGVAESARFTRTGLDMWQRMIDVNMTGTFLTLREGVRQMAGRSWGRLIAVSSTAGLKGYPYVSAYAASKHGVVGLVRAVAQELADTGVTANALCPGYVRTDMTERTVANIVATTDRSAEQALAALTSANPQARLIEPAEVTAAALWLCGPGSEGVTGQAIAIAGGEV